MLKTVVGEGGRTRDDASVYVVKTKRRIELRLRIDSGGKVKLKGRKYVDVRTAKEDAKILGAMLKSSHWRPYPANLIWDVWLFTVAVERYLRECEQGTAGPSAITKAIARRARYKYCLTPGTADGCYRQTWGQYCVMGPGIRWDRFSTRYKIDIHKIGLTKTHQGPQRKQCADMLAERACVAHYCSHVASYATVPFRVVLGAEKKDSRLCKDTEDIRKIEVPRIDSCLSARGTEEVGLLVATFLTSQNYAVTSRAAQSLSLIPAWADLRAVGAMEAGGSMSVTTVLDRNSIRAASRASLDRVYPAIVLGSGNIGAHVPGNMRMVDSARNWPKGGLHTTMVADLPEAAIVCHNALRWALGDNVADAKLAEIQTKIADAWVRESLLLEGARTKPWDWAKAHASQMEIWRETDPVWNMLGAYPTASHTAIVVDVSSAAEALLKRLGRQDPESDGLAGTQGGNWQESSSAQEDSETNDAEMEHSTEPPLAIEAAGQAGTEAGNDVASGASEASIVAEEIESDGFVPDDADDDSSQATDASFAAESEEQGQPDAEEYDDEAYEDDIEVEEWDLAAESRWPRADNAPCTRGRAARGCTCTDSGQKSRWGCNCRREPRAIVARDIAAEIKANRSPATLYLKWVKEGILGRLRTCTVTGMPLVFPRLGQQPRRPLRTSLAAHGTHKWPIDYGWTVPWRLWLDSAVAVRHQRIPRGPGERRSSELVRQQMAYLQSWRIPALRATLLRRTEWYLERGAVALGLTPLSAEQAAVLRATCGDAVEFIGLPASRPNSIKLGEQVVRMRGWTWPERGQPHVGGDPLSGTSFAQVEAT
ncbi:unnamed protein product [Parajaminaea phylloscopi]